MNALRRLVLRWLFPLAHNRLAAIRWLDHDDPDYVLAIAVDCMDREYRRERRERREQYTAISRHHHQNL